MGHAYSPDSLLADHANGLERALWSAVRTFDERAALLRRLGKRKYHSGSVGPHWEANAKELEQHAELIRNLLQATIERSMELPCQRPRPAAAFLLPR